MSKAEATRLMILQKSFDLIYRKGFQATSIDDIIATTQVTKGAFFYHFKNKDEMGLAMIHEVMFPGMQQVLIRPLKDAADPVNDIHLMMKNLLLKAPFFDVKYGCPVVNLIDEMGPLHEGFKKVLGQLFTQWQQAIKAAVNNGKANGAIRKAVDAKQVAFFVISGYSGIRNMGKLSGPSCYGIYLAELKNYLGSLA